MSSVIDVTAAQSVLGHAITVVWMGTSLMSMVRDGDHDHGDHTVNERRGGASIGALVASTEVHELSR
jgi:hypothetical protein